MRKIFTASLSAAFLWVSTPVLAEPYCDALTAKKSLPKKYKNKAPFYSDAKQGWIIGNDQLRVDFSISDEARFLLRQIVNNFNQRGVTLAVVIPPPRPLFIKFGQNQTLGGYQAEKANQNFRRYIRSLNDLGIISPDILTPAEIMLKERYYFLRDTHWTPEGSALTAIILANELGVVADVNNTFAKVRFNENYSEKGSLSSVVGKICRQSLPPEIVKIASFTQVGDAASLLMAQSTHDPEIALAGSSFSSRYGRDVYRFSDALAFALAGPVDNYSVSGGGVISAIETLILSDAFKSGRYKTVVWEVPYTQNLSVISSLRQILGALNTLEAKSSTQLYKGRLGGQWRSVSYRFSGSGIIAVAIHANSSDISQIDLEFYEKKKKKLRVKLQKSIRIPASRRSDIWTVSLAGIDVTKFTRLKIRLKGAVSSHDVSLHLLKHPK